MAIFELAPGPSNPRNSFLVKRGMSCGNNNAYQYLPSGLAQLQKFMDNVPWPLPLGNQSPLLLTAPAPMKVDANACPSEEAIWQSMIRMDKGTGKKGKQSQLLAIQHPSAEISMERFCNISMYEVKEAGIDLTYIYQEFGNFKYKVDGFQAEKATLSSWCQSQDKTNAENISNIQEVLTNQKKRIGLLEEDLDVTFLENQAYTDKLDEHRALVASIQDQLERANRKMASLKQKLDNLPNQHQHRGTERQSQGSYQNSSGQEEYHSLESNKKTNQRLPCFIQVQEMVIENGGPATVTIEDTVQYLKAQHKEAHKAASKAHFAASKAKCNRPTSLIW
ncbi:hypothetical protein DSO57_1000971 [Entomophthora muscae]|uniref:Uncharacterized protein n=1 Tax=Entomophthora muscae TaxID=34485 RepID=A0ACC2UIT6_9FUNG|nr:hypothetical protein DSO57_1000971 [Entomophthora muscae]